MLERALLDAVWEELRERGFQAMTMAGVAERAGAAKSVVYRRWPDKLAAVQAVVRERVPRLGETRFSGDLRADSLVVLERMSAAFQGVQVMSDADPAVRQRLQQAVVAETIDLLADALAAAGIDAATVGEHVVRVPADVLAYALLSEHAAPAPERLIDDIFLPLITLHATR